MIDLSSRPLLKLVDRLLLVGMLKDEDVDKLLIMVDPETWDPTFDKEGKNEHSKGLLSMKMAEGAKLQMCYLLHHLCDIQLRHRVEAIIAFSTDFVGELQGDQLRRYIEIKQSDLPSAVAAKKTKEFRCPPKEQMNAILGIVNILLHGTLVLLVDLISFTSINFVIISKVSKTSKRRIRRIAPWVMNSQTR